MRVAPYQAGEPADLLCVPVFEGEARIVGNSVVREVARDEAQGALGRIERRRRTRHPVERMGRPKEGQARGNRTVPADRHVRLQT